MSVSVSCKYTFRQEVRVRFWHPLYFSSQFLQIYNLYILRFNRSYFFSSMLSVFHAFSFSASLFLLKFAYLSIYVLLLIHSHFSFQFHSSFYFFFHYLSVPFLIQEISIFSMDSFLVSIENVNADAVVALADEFITLDAPVTNRNFSAQSMCIRWSSGTSKTRRGEQASNKLRVRHSLYATNRETMSKVCLRQCLLSDSIIASGWSLRYGL